MSLLGSSNNAHSHLCLHHAAAVVSHAPHEPKYVHLVLQSYLPQLRVESDECASPAHSSTAVDHDGTSIGRIRGGYFTNKV